MMKVAIVILNWNGQQMLADYLGQVVEYSKDEAEIIVADNGSTDDSVEWVRTHFPEVRIIQLDRNYGFAEGYNKALVQVDCTYYVLLNSDVEVTPHWLTPLIEEMDARPEVAACQPKILSEVRKGSFEYAGACGGYIDRFGYPFCRGRIFDTVEEDHGQYDTPQEVLWASGCCLMIRADDYWSADGLDGRFFAHNEEIDLCWRLYQTGRKIFCFPQSTVYHVGGGTLPKGNPRKTFLNFRNNLTMLWKTCQRRIFGPSCCGAGSSTMWRPGGPSSASATSATSRPSTAHAGPFLPGATISIPTAALPPQRRRRSCQRMAESPIPSFGSIISREESISPTCRSKAHSDLPQ